MTYSCILMDPAWHEPGGNGRGADDQYDTIREPSEILRTIVTAPCWAPAAMPGQGQRGDPRVRAGRAGAVIERSRTVYPRQAVAS